MVFKPAADESRWEGLAVCAWIAITQILLLQWASQRPTDWVRFVLFFALIGSVPLLLFVLYRTWIAFSLEYWLDRNALTVRWADVRQTIPLSSLRQMLLDVPDAAPASRIDWPALYVRPAVPGGLAMLATRPLAQCLVLDAGDQRFALSPAAQSQFIEAVQERVRMGPVANVPMASARRVDPARLLSADRTGLILLALGLAGALLVFGALMVRFPSLPDVLTVRYTTEGIPEQVREKESLFLLPAIGMMAWVVNGVWGLVMAARKQKPGAYLLWGGTLLVQLSALLALLTLTG